MPPTASQLFHFATYDVPSADQREWSVERAPYTSNFEAEPVRWNVRASRECVRAEPANLYNGSKSHKTE